jgi:hypothetical protein
MAQRVEIDCINKSGRRHAHERILFVGGPNPSGSRWKLSQQQAVEGIKNAKWAFYVNVGGRSVAVLVARGEWGHEYLKTEADGTEPDSLLRLPECR